MTNQSDIEKQEAVINDLMRRLEEANQKLEKLKFKPIYIGTVFKNNDKAEPECADCYVWVYTGNQTNVQHVLNEYCFGIQEGGFGEFRPFTHNSFYGFARVFKVFDKYYAVFCNNPLNYNSPNNLNTEMAEKYLIDALKTKVVKDPDRRNALSDGQYFVSDLVEQDIDRKFTVMSETHLGNVNIGDNIILDAISERFREPEYEFTLEKTGEKIYLLGSTVIMDAKNEKKDIIKVRDLTKEDLNSVFEVVELTDDDSWSSNFIKGDKLVFLDIENQKNNYSTGDCSNFGFVRHESSAGNTHFLDWETTLKRLD